MNALRVSLLPIPFAAVLLAGCSGEAETASAPNPVVETDRVFGQPPQHQVTRKIPVIRVRFHDLVGIDGIKNDLARYETALDSEMHMIRPEDSAAANTGLDECYGTFWCSPTNRLQSWLLLLEAGLHFEAFLLCRCQQLAVCQGTPTPLESCFHLMRVQMFAQGHGRSLIEKYAHSIDLGHRQAFGRMVENLARLFDSDAGEPLNKLSYLDSIFQVFKESRNWDARAAKHPAAA